MATRLAMNFKRFDEILIVLYVNNEDFDETLGLIYRTKDNVDRCNLMVKYASILMKHRPKGMLQLLREPEFNDISKIEMISVFITMEDDYHNLISAADYVNDIWIH